MKRIPLVFAALVGVAALPALSQQLLQPAVPTTKPVAPPGNSGVGPQLDQPQPVQSPSRVRDPELRPSTANAIPSTGPAQEVPTGPASPSQKLKKPASVLDANGKPVDGLIQVAPNRVYDPATGKYRWTETSGQGQKVLDPSK
ncbi:MAG: hypothetical protein ABWY94_06775 [Pseudoxanthomonas sp.]